MITGCLQQKNGYYYVLLYLKVDGKRKDINQIARVRNQ